jgi:hypothetical protein
VHIPSPTTHFVERLGMIVGISLVACMMFTTAAPYFMTIPPASIRLIDQQQTILQSVLMVLVGYLWGNSAGNKSKDATIEKQAHTILEAQSALVPPPAVTLAPGESATVKADEP